jgi:zinc protease
MRQLGTIKSVRGLTNQKLARFHRGVLCADEMVVTVSGDVCAKEVRELLDAMLTDLPRKGMKPPKLSSDPAAKKPRERTVTKREKEQAHIVVGFQGTTFKGADRYAMAVLNNILSGQGGRLFLTLRDRMGLAYAVSSIHHEGIDPGYFAVYIGTEPGKIEVAKKGIIEQLQAMVREAPTDEELQRSKQYLVGSFEIELQRNGALASTHTFNQLYGLGPDEVEKYPKRIMAITAEDVLKVARKYIRPEAYTMAVVKPA